MVINGYADKNRTQLMCLKGGPLRKCGRVAVGAAFSIDVVALEIPPEGYTRFQAVVRYDASLFNLQQQAGLDEVIWPDEDCDAVGGVETKELGQYIVA